MSQGSAGKHSANDPLTLPPGSGISALHVYLAFDTRKDVELNSPYDTNGKIISSFKLVDVYFPILCLLHIQEQILTPFYTSILYFHMSFLSN